MEEKIIEVQNELQTDLSESLAEEAEAKKKTSVHKDHKKRLREKFELHDDFTGFYEHEMLEMLLSYSIIRQDTNKTAHALIDHFGSLSAVFEASREEIKSVAGIGDRTATLLIMQRALFGAYNKCRFDMSNKSISNKESLTEYIKSLFSSAKNEQLYMLCVSSGGKITKTHLLTRGSDDYVNADPRNIVKVAINADSKGVIFAHNHPTGVPQPSENDIKTTVNLQTCLSMVGIQLIEHYVVADDSCLGIKSDKRFKFYK